MKRAVILLVMAAAALGGCAKGYSLTGRTAPEKELGFETTLVEGKDGILVVAIEDRGAPLSVHREAARFPVTAHCMETKGRSDALWVLDASGSDWLATRDAQGRLVYQARCRA